MIALGKHPYIFMLETEAHAIEEVMNLEQECHLQQIRDYDMTNISIHHAHPIVYDACNICDFFSSKLLPFLKKTAAVICSGQILKSASNHILTS